MRPRLVAVGLAIGLVGAGLVASVVLFPTGTNGTFSSTITLGVVPGAVSNWTINITQSSVDSLVVSWSTTGPANVSLYRLTPCSGGTGLCPVVPAVESWTTSAGGRWSTSGSFGPGFVLSVDDGASRSISFSGTATEGYHTKGANALPEDSLILIGAAAAVLLVIGGLATYLGLFLPGGVYDRNPPDRPTRYPAIDPDLEDEPREDEEL